MFKYLTTIFEWIFWFLFLLDMVYEVCLNTLNKHKNSSTFPQNPNIFHSKYLEVFEENAWNEKNAKNEENQPSKQQPSKQQPSKQQPTNQASDNQVNNRAFKF